MSVQISQVYQFTDNTTFDPRRLQWELNNIANTINNANAGLLTWDSIKTTILTVTNAPTLSALTASRVVVTDANKALSSSGVTSATLAFLDATSSVQTQLNGKVATSTTVNGHALSSNVTVTASDVSALPTSGGTLTGNLAFDSVTHGVTGASGSAVASTGNVGEVLSANATGVSIGTSIANLTSLSITAGIWMVVATVSDNGASASNTFFAMAISANSASFTGTTDGLDKSFPAINSGNGASIVLRFVTQSTTATWYLPVQSSNGSTSYSGSIRAIRIA